MTTKELTVIHYPIEWEKEYRETGFVRKWREDYKSMFVDHKGSSRIGTLDLFAQYALMYLLCKQDGIHSITWYKIANVSRRSINRERTLRYWEVMKKWMGEGQFVRLQSHLIRQGFKTISGEPDLFCWNAKNGQWFFAEAKGKDRVHHSQEKWHEACRQILPRVEIRFYQLVSDKRK